MSPGSKRRRRATRPGPARPEATRPGPARPEPTAVWDFGGAFGASLRAWNRRRDEVPGEPTPAPGGAPLADQPRVMSSRTRGVWQ
jgi:hypothetical protein